MFCGLLAGLHRYQYDGCLFLSVAGPCSPNCSLSSVDAAAARRFLLSGEGVSVVASWSALTARLQGCKGQALVLALTAMAEHVNADLDDAVVRGVGGARTEAGDAHAPLPRVTALERLTAVVLALLMCWLLGSSADI